MVSPINFTCNPIPVPTPGVFYPHSFFPDCKVIRVLLKFVQVLNIFCEDYSGGMSDYGTKLGFYKYVVILVVKLSSAYVFINLQMYDTPDHSYYI